MAEFDIGQTTTPTIIDDYSISTKSTDGAGESGETRWFNNNFNKWYGKYNSSSKIKASIKAYATWVIGLGWTAKPIYQEQLDGITGWGKDSFTDILWNMLVIKKVNGDSYAHIIRNDSGTFLNLKPLDPASMVHVVGPDGVLIRYEQISKIEGADNQKYLPHEILHFTNDRVADNIHGDSVIDSLMWNLDAQEEARRMYRKKVKNSGAIGVLEADTDDTTKLTNLKDPIKKAVEEGTFLIVPKDLIGIKEFAIRLNTQELIQWLNYLDDEYYQIIGLPKIIGGASGEIEGDSKVSYLAFEPVYKRAINELKDDLWNQMAIKIDINLPPSLNKEVLGNEQKNASQTGFQPNDTTAGVGV